MGRSVLSLVAAISALVFSQTAITAIRTPHFNFVPDAGSMGVADRLASVAETKRKYVLGLLGVDDRRVIEVRIASDEETMMSMIGTKRPVRGWIAGIAMSDRNLVVLSARGNEVFRAVDTFVHELAHIYLHAALGGGKVPRWFNEGFAMLVASERVGERLKTIMGAAATGSFIPLDEISDGFPMSPPTVHLAYAQSMLFVRYLSRTGGRSALASLITGVRGGMSFDMVFEHVFGGTETMLFEQFKGTLDQGISIVWVITSSAVLWVLVTLLFLYAYLTKRQRAAKKRKAWQLEEEIERIRRQARDRGVDPDEVQ